MNKRIISTLLFSISGFGAKADDLKLDAAAKLITDFYGENALSLCLEQENYLRTRGLERRKKSRRSVR